MRAMDISSSSKKTEKFALLPAEEAQSLIITIRGKQVLLDSDVAKLYGYETKSINQAANRNIKRF